MPSGVLRASFPLGSTVDLRSADPVRDDLAHAVGWGPGRTVRAEVIAGLLLGAAGKLHPGSVAAVRLAGARITGCLDLADGQIAFLLELVDCLLEKRPELARARTRTVRLTRCSSPGLDASWAQVDGHLFAENCILGGTLELYGAHVTGEVILSGTRISTEHGPAVWATGSPSTMPSVPRAGSPARENSRPEARQPAKRIPRRSHSSPTQTATRSPRTD